MADQTIGAIVLAAGVSKRFGGDKRLAVVNGRTVAELTLEKYCQQFTHVRIVVRGAADPILPVISDFPVEVCNAPDAHLGMGHSLASGTIGLTWDYAFVALLDMPFVKPDTLARLRDAADADQDGPIIRPQLADGRWGHPIGFARCFFGQLAQCSGDVGARQLLSTHNVTAVTVEDPGILQDIDRPEDL